MEAPQRYQDNDFWLDIENVVIGPEIGKGQFSTVYVGKYFGDLVAVKKQIRTEVLVEAYILRELSVLKVATHKNLVQYIGACNHENIDGKGSGASYIVTELCVGGDLLRLLLNSDLELNWKTRIKIAMQAADAIRFLHKKQVVHRDIKSSNILLDEEWNCKISDFGMARFVEVECNTPPRTNSFATADGKSVPAEKALYKRVSSNSSLLTSNRRMTICGTEEYMAPEMLFDEEYSFGVDIFCFGMMIFEILKRGQVGKDGFLVRKPKEKFMIKHDALKTQLPSDLPESMFSLATQCTDFDPTLRPDSEQTLDWMQDIFAEHEQDAQVDAAAGPPPAMRSKSIRLALSTLAAKEAESSKQAAEHQTGKSAAPVLSSAMFSPQPVPPAAGKVSFTSPSGVFKSLFHSVGGTAAATPASTSQAAQLPSQDNAGLSVPKLSLTEQELYERFILHEEEYKLPLIGSDQGELSEEGEATLKEGFLFKINETGFRNWKQVLCTLTDTKLSWVTTSDTSKKIVFTLKDTTVRRTRDKRFLLSQKMLAMVSNKPSKAKGSDNNESAAPRIRSATPDNANLAHMVQGGSTTVNGTASTAGTATNGQSGAASVASSLGNGSASAAQYSLLQKELAAQSVEEMESWIHAIQSAIHTAINTAADHRTTESSDAPVSQVDMRAPPLSSLEECLSVEQWLYTTGLPAEYCEQYRAALEAKGYDSVELIGKVGLQDTDLDYLEINIPAHRRVLAACARGHYSSTLRLCVTSVSKSDSSGAAVKVISRWHYHRSAVQLPLSQLRKFDKVLRKVLQGDAVLQTLPALPSEVTSRDVQSSKLIRHKAELYLLQLASLLDQSPHLMHLLKFLELSASASGSS